METKQQLQLVTHSQAKRLYDVGFDRECDYSYIKAQKVYTAKRTNSDYRKGGYIARYTAPTVALALKWFRDAKGLVSGICPDEWEFRNYYPVIAKTADGQIGLISYSNYEAAESALLDVLLNIIEKKKKYETEN
jgi:hypothetical protein